MRQETWEKLDEMFRKHPVMKAEPVSFEEINESEARLGTPLQEDYRQFVHRYGGAIVGPFPIFGLRRAKPMGKEESLLDMTTHFRQQKWPGVDNWVVVSIDHSGNPIGLDAEGRIWISDHDAGSVQMIAPNFEVYLRKSCLKLND